MVVSLFKKCSKSKDVEGVGIPMKTLKKFPFHSIAFSMYPILALLATNLSEIELGVAVRPIILSVLGTTILLD